MLLCPSAIPVLCMALAQQLPQTHAMLEMVLNQSPIRHIPAEEVVPKTQRLKPALLQIIVLQAFPAQLRAGPLGVNVIRI